MTFLNLTKHTAVGKLPVFLRGKPVIFRLAAPAPDTSKYLFRMGNGSAKALTNQVGNGIGIVAVLGCAVGNDCNSAF